MRRTSGGISSNATTDSAWHERSYTGWARCTSPLRQLCRHVRTAVPGPRCDEHQVEFLQTPPQIVHGMNVPTRGGRGVPRPYAGSVAMFEPQCPDLDATNIRWNFFKRHHR